MWENAYSIASGLFDRWKRAREVGDFREASIRLLAIEIRRNLAVLDALRSDAAQDDPDYRALAALLDTSVTEQILMAESVSVKVMQKLGKLELPDEANHEKGNAEIAADVLTRVYVRIATVQALARVEPRGEALRAIRYRERLHNIRCSLVALLEALDPPDER